MDNNSKMIQVVHEKFNKLLTCDDERELTQMYDALASDYDKFSDVVRRKGHIEAASAVTKAEPDKNARILDVACGTGLVGVYLHESGYHNLYGVDMSKKLIEIAEDKRVYKELIQSMFGPETPLTYENGYFDVAVASECFLPKHLNETHLPEMLRLVKQGGYVVFTLRKNVYDNEEDGMKLKSRLFDLVQENRLQKISHYDHVLKEVGNHMGVTMCYKLLN